MESFADCKWRRGDRERGFRCISPAVGPKKVTAQVCHACDVIDHVSTERLDDRIDKQLPANRNPALRAIHECNLGLETFQGSIIEHDGRVLLAARQGLYGGRIRIVELDSRYQAIRGGLDATPAVDLPPGGLGCEDPRLFTVGGLLHISFSAVRNEGGFLKSTIMVGRVERDGQITKILEPDPPITRSPDGRPHTRDVEKNWMFFHHEQGLFVLYADHPQRSIFRLDGTVLTALSSLPRPGWLHGEVRGGAPPVRSGDEYYHFFHGRSVNGKHINYTCGLYTFDAVTLAVKRILPVPLLQQPPGEFAKRPDLEGIDLQVVFPCGALFKGGRWVVSYGHQDVSCRVAEFDAGEIEKQLVKVTTGQPEAGKHEPAKKVRF